MSYQGLLRVMPAIYQIVGTVLCQLLAETCVRTYIYPECTNHIKVAGKYWYSSSGRNPDGMICSTSYDDIAPQVTSGGAVCVQKNSMVIR